MKAFTNESERAAFEAQMLYGSHVFARAKVIPDMATREGPRRRTATRRRSATRTWSSWRPAGPRWRSSTSATSTTPGRGSIVPRRSRPSIRARSARGGWRRGGGSRTPPRATPRGCGRTWSAPCSRRPEPGQIATRCEALARLAVESARLGAETDDEELMALAERSAAEASELASALPGSRPVGRRRPTRPARGSRSRAGRADEATAFARAAGDALQAARHEDLQLDVLLPSARVLMETGAPEWEAGVRSYVQLSLAMVAQRTMDQDVRVRWLRGPLGREMAALAGPLDTIVASDGRTDAPADGNDLLLQSLVQGKTNAEIAGDLGIDEQAVERRLGELFATIGASSRADATAFAFHGAGPVRATCRARVDRHRCVGAGTCITIAPTAFDWYEGDFAKAGVVDPASVEDEVLREAALACPTGAITIEDVEELLPWQLRGKDAPRRVEKTFMFTDIESSTNLVEALGDEVWQGVLRWHDETLRSLFAEHKGEEVVATGDGFFVGFDSPDEALACAVAIQRRLAEHRRSAGFAPKVRIGLHASGATQVGKNFSGKGVHEASRIAALADGDQIVASRATAADGRYPDLGAADRHAARNVRRRSRS